MNNRSYNLRSSGVKPPRRNSREFSAFSTSTVSSTMHATGSTNLTSPDGTAFTEENMHTATPAPVQRTLYMHEEEMDEDEDDQHAAHRQQQARMSEVQYHEQEQRSMHRVTPRFGFAAMRGPPAVHSDEESMDASDSEDDNLEEEDDMEEDDEVFDDEEEDDDMHQRGLRRRRQPSPFERVRQQAVSFGFISRLWRSQQVQKMTKSLHRGWQFLLRNSFMTANVLWLLVPIGCLLLAIFVPAYLSTAVRYVDVLDTSGPQIDITAEKNLMRTLVQEIVDVKLASMQSEITTLQKTIVSQAREIEALRLLHESVRQVVEENQKKMSIGDTNSMLSIHIEHEINRHTDGFWRKLEDKTSANEERLQKALNEQAIIAKEIARQHVDLKNTKGNSIPIKEVDDEKLRQEVDVWKAEVHSELQVSVQEQLSMIEDRMHQSLLNEKKVLVDSVAGLKKLDSENPALVSMIESAVVEVDARKAGSVDFAALANGASVVWSKKDFFDEGAFSPTALVHKLISPPETVFTSDAFRPVSLFSALSWWPRLDIPWWLSRHNGRPETALSETMEIGSCWGMRGSSGQLTVRFATPIVADSITLDHIPHQVATDFSTAPRDVRIVGISVDKMHDSIQFTPLGNFSYVQNGSSSQTFALTSSISRQLVIDGATLEITSNHGHPDYTCLYRFRVHGHLASA